MSLPSLSLHSTGAGRSDWPPDPIAAGEFYRGVVSRRVFAYLIDVLVIGLLVMAIHMVFGMMTLLSFGLLAFLHLLALPLLVALTYHTVLIAGPWHATLGMRCLGLRVHHMDGGDPDLIQAFVQTVCFYGTLGFGGGILLLLALFNIRHRTLHDFLAGILVLRTFGD